MAATRRKTSSAAPKPSPETPPETKPPPSSADFAVAPPKLAPIAAAAAAFFVPFFYLAFVYYRIDPDLRRSIAISAGMSFAGFVLVVRLIPVAARYLLRRNLFGFDINKKGTTQGAIKVFDF